MQVTLLRYHVGGGSRTVSVGGYEVPSRRYWTRWARWVGVHHAKQRGGYELFAGRGTVGHLSVGIACCVVKTPAPERTVEFVFSPLAVFKLLCDAPGRV